MAEINYSFTEQRESSPESIKSDHGATAGYLPKFGDSGLTVGWGVDVSHYTLDTMKDWGVPKEDLKILKDYAATKYKSKDGKIYEQYGPQGAQLAIRGSSLDIYERDSFGNRIDFSKKISEDGLKALNKGVREKFTKEAKKEYESLSGIKGGWDILTSAQQTTLYDIAYSSGGKFIAKKTKKLKEYVSKNRWDLIEQELASDDWDNTDIPRRNAQAELLRLEKNSPIKKNNDEASLIKDWVVQDDPFGFA